MNEFNLGTMDTALFFWLAVGFMSMYAVISAFLFNANGKQPVVVRVDETIHAGTAGEE
jgi:hypothetical protein